MSKAENDREQRELCVLRHGLAASECAGSPVKAATHRRRRWFGITAALVALPWATDVRAVNLNDPAVPPGGIANYWDTANTQPNVVALFDLVNNTSQCTGTLINSRTILTAAHCLVGNGTNFISPTNAAYQIRFNPNALISSTNDSAQSGALVNPGYNSSAHGVNDIALISLANPVTNVTPVTLLKASDPMPAVGTLVVIAGYGLAGTGTAPNTVDDSRRRIGQTNIGAFMPPSAGAPVAIAAQFRDPTTPSDPDQFGLNARGVAVPTLQAQPGPGDSGGPLFIVTANGLVQIGTVIGGGNGYGAIDTWEQVQLYDNFITTNNPLRLSSSQPGIFSWSQSAAWLDTLGRSEVPNNGDGNFNNFGALGRYYDVTIAAPSIMTLDMNPTIDTLAIAGAQSQLVLPVGFTLTTVLSTTLSAGTLAMDGGKLSSPEVLINGGLLEGNGTIVSNGGSTGLCATGVCNIGGTVMPIQTLAIQGNYTQAGSGVLAYQLSPAGASGRLAVTGTAALGGTLAATVTPGLYGSSTNYTDVLTASTVNGQFAQVVPSASAFLTLTATYNPNSVDLTLNRTPFGAVPGLSGNQRAVGNVLEASYSTNLSGQQALFYTNILASPTTNVLTELSGESNAGAGQIAAFQFTNQFLLLMLDPFGQDRGGFGAGASGPAGGPASRFAPEREIAPETAQAYAAVTPTGRAAAYWAPRWNLWAAAFGGTNNTSGDPAGAGTHSFAARTGGIAAGLDYKVTPDTLIGFALAGGDTSWGLAQGLGGGHSDAFQAGLYGSQLFGAAYLSGALAFANYWTATSRGVAVASIDTLNASFDAQSWAGRAEAGYKLAWAPVNFTPYAAVQAQSYHTPSFSEASSSGSNLYALNYALHTGSVTRAEFGSWLSNNYLLAGGAEAVLFGRAAWAHDWQENLQAAATFLTVPAASFIVNGAKPASNLAVVTAGAELRLAQGISLMGKFDGEFGQGTNTYTGTARVRYLW